MDFHKLIDAMTPAVYENLKRAVELGKWPDGKRLAPEQRETCLQAMIAWEHRHTREEERTGFIPPRSHAHCGGDGELADAEQPLRWDDG